MAKINKITQSFNSGELSPLMDSRIDQEKYNSGNKTMENFIPLIYGGAQRRPGLEYITSAISSSAKSRLVGFEHSVDDTYVLEFGNQAMRFFKDGVQITADTYSETISVGTLVCQYACNDDLATTNVINTDNPGTLDATATANTDTIHIPGRVGTGAFELNSKNSLFHADNASFSFGNGTVDSPFSIAAVVKVSLTSHSQQTIMSKFNAGAGNREWVFYLDGSGNLVMVLSDESAGVNISRTSDAAITEGWHHVAMTYTGQSTTGSTAANFIKLYIDGSLVASTATNSGTYDAMEDKTARLGIGAQYANDGTTEELFWDSDIDNVALFSDELSAANVASLVVSGNPYSIQTPYLTADLFDLKFENSADVMFISHPNYEDRRLSRFSDDDWQIEVAGIETGPFRDQNLDTSQTISASATTGSVTLTATNVQPFRLGSVSGHSPSGSDPTAKSQTGTLFKLVHASNTPSISGFLITNDATDNSTAELAVPNGITWDLTTNGTWGTAADSATIQLQREYNNSGVWEAVATVTSAANRNLVTSGTEDFADAQYRVSVTEAGGDASEVDILLSIRDTSHIGIVRITSVTSSTVAVGTVLTTLGSTDATHRWSEGSFSNFRGWPIDVAISSEERLTFTGNISEPLTIWGSAIGDFTDFSEGINDDSPIQFTLVGSGQQNRIRWTVAKETLVLGTVGGEHLLGASKDEEAITPTNVKAKLQTTYGSENVAAKIVNQAILFVQRGGKKVREFLYNFEADAHKADDLTVFAEHITGDGIVDMAFQRTPDPILWCVRTDGQIALMSYERDQNVFSWSRLVTTDSTADSVIESVAVIYGGTRAEDEVWVSILRKINSSNSRTIERFNVRDLPASATDYKFVDAYITATPVGTTVSGLDHLEGETVQVLGDGIVQTEAASDDFDVTGGDITVPAGLTTCQVGLGYSSTLVPMDIDIQGTGLATTKRVNRATINLFETISGQIGPNSSNLETIPTGTSLFTGHKEISIPGGYTRDTDITIKQTQPLPMTLLSLTYDLGASRD